MWNNIAVAGAEESIKKSELKVIKNGRKQLLKLEIEEHSLKL